MISERERKLVEAAKDARAKLAVHRPHDCYPDGSVIPGPSEILRKIDAALAAYASPPNPVFSQDVALDSRDNASLGHRDNFGMKP